MRVALLLVLKNVVRHGIRCFRRATRRPSCKFCADEHGESPSPRRGVRRGFEGVDWAERRRSDDAVKRRKRVQRARKDALLKRRREDDSAGSSGRSSNKSASDSSSSAMSPVLSATTLQTTPSPPPLSDEGVDVRKKEEYLRRMTIPVSPVLNPPRLLRLIPYVPVTTANMPHYSLEAFKAVSFYFYIFF